MNTESRRAADGSYQRPLEVLDVTLVPVCLAGPIFQHGIRFFENLQAFQVCVQKSR